ncbi:MAG: S1C family serine protease [Gammaproteobacteria bacterium]
MNNYLNYILSILIGICLGALIFNYSSSNSDRLEQESDRNNALTSYNLAVNRASPAVVNIYSDKLVSTYQKSPFSDRFNSIFGNPNRKRVESSLGSGVIFSSDGYVLTNQHVIGDLNLNIIVELNDGTKEKATVIGIDKGTDLAVLKIEPSNELISIEIGDSNNLRIGDVVLAIGNPYGLGKSVSMGIISATGREFENPYSDYIQTDASINRGNSGGALIDTKGRLIGINTLIKSSSGGSEGIGLSIPSVTVLSIVNDLIQYGEVNRGWLGFGIDRKEIRKGNLVIGSIHEYGPADKASLEIGDTILEINNEKGSYKNLYQQFARSKPGTEINLKVRRDGEIIDFVLIAGRVPKE